MTLGLTWIDPARLWSPRPWTVEEQKLIAWYYAQRRAKKLPRPPFRLNQYAEIVDGDKFYTHIDGLVGNRQCTDRMVMYYVLDLLRFVKANPVKTQTQEATNEGDDLFPEDAPAHKPVPAADEALSGLSDIFE
jgi:hypothetical protein